MNSAVAGSVLALPGVALAVGVERADLASDEMLASIRFDPWWPKWDAVWWRIMILDEMGLVAEVPQRTLDALLPKMNAHYLREFVLRFEDMPPGGDGRNSICFCALGGMARALARRGVEVPLRLSWVVPYFLRYRFPDGGLNCDEGAHLRTPLRSSFQSTVPVAEALLAIHGRTGLPPEVARLLEGACGYLLARKLARSLSKDRCCDEAWYTPVFPRFYRYDALRGLTLVARWAAATGARLPREAIAEPVARLEAFFASGEPPRVGPPANHPSAPPEFGALSRRPLVYPPLLERARRGDVGRLVLEAEWSETRALLAGLD